MAATLALIWAMSEGGMFFTSCRARHLEMDRCSEGPLCSPHPSPRLVLPQNTLECLLMSLHPRETKPLSLALAALCVPATLPILSTLVALWPSPWRTPTQPSKPSSEADFLPLPAPGPPPTPEDSPQEAEASVTSVCLAGCWGW